MSYLGRTKLFGVPYMTYGERMTEEDNAHQMQVVDALLYLSSSEVGSRLIVDAEYQLDTRIFNGKHQYRVVATAAVGEQYVLMGVVDGRFFQSAGSGITRSDNTSVTGIASGWLDWPSLDTSVVGFTGDKKIVAYAVLNARSGVKNSNDHGDFGISVDVLVHGDTAPAGNAFTLCRIEFNFEDGHEYEFTLESDGIPGKPVEVRNPHGATLVQDRLEVVKSLSARGLQMPSVVYAQCQSAGSGSSASIPFPAEMTVLFAMASAEDPSAGAVACGIDLAHRQVLVKNAGDAGVAVNVRLDVVMDSEAPPAESEEEQPGEEGEDAG